MAQQIRSPFTRLPVTDVQTAANAISDIYDKLNVLAARLDQNGKDAPQTAPVSQPQQQSGTPRVFTKSTLLMPTDGIVIGEITSATSLVLPRASTVTDKVFTVLNSTTSTAALTLQSPFNEKVGGAAASTYSLTAGDSMTIQSTGAYWNVLKAI